MKEEEYKCLNCICRECVNPACKNALCDGAVDVGFNFHCFTEAYGNGSACFMSLSDLVRIQDEASKM